MPEVTISPANPLHFQIATTGGSVNDGGFFPDNDLYPSGETSCGVYHPPYRQVFSCTDVLTVQIYWDNTDSPTLEIVDEDGNSLYMNVAVISNTYYYTYTINLGTLVSAGTLTCDSCYQLKLYSNSVGSNLFTSGDSGTFDANIFNVATGFFNSMTHETVAPIRTGTGSVQVQNSGSISPSVANLVITTNSYNLTSGQRYKIKGYIYSDSVAPITTEPEAEIYFSIAAFSDATGVTYNAYTYSDGTGAWVEFYSEFTVGSDTNGNFKVVISAAGDVNPSGLCHFDDFTLTEISQITEATSELFQITDNLDCHMEITYTNSDDNSLDIDWSGNPTFRIRLPMIRRPQQYETDKTIAALTDGNYTVTNSQSRLIHPFESGGIPPYLWNIFRLATLCDTFKIDGLQYVTEEDLESETTERYGLVRGKGKFIVADENLKTFA